MRENTAITSANQSKTAGSHYIASVMPLKFQKNGENFFKSNVFLLTLLSLIEKTPKENINIFVVRMKNYETNVTNLNIEQIAAVLDFNSDVFLNLDRIID